MATDPQNPPSFSPRRKWLIGLNVLFAVVVVLAIVVMVNYLASQYAQRFYLSTLTRIELSPRTLGLLRSLTNEVAVTIYYDKEDPLYSDIADLLKEYNRKNTKVAVRTVDYYHEPSAAQEMKMKYKLGSSTNRNFIIFDCGGHTKFVNGGELPDYTMDILPNQPQLTYDKKLISFKGELKFTSALFAVVNPKPAKAYFLRGHEEASIDDADNPEAFHGFAEMLALNYIQPEPLDLLTAAGVPADCTLLVIAAPQKTIPDNQLEKIQQYLDQGGRMLVLFNFKSLEINLGLEGLLNRWGVGVGRSYVKEPPPLTTAGWDMIVPIVPGRGLHPITRPLIDGAPLHLVLPRPISRLDAPAKSTVELPQVTEIVYSSAASFATDNTVPRAYPLAVAVEKGAGKSGTNGPTRLVVCGDYFLFDNQLIDDTASANRNFADAVVNWLVERPVLLEGIGPRNVTEFRLLMNQNQLKGMQWVLLAGLPGAILLFGGLVWLSRRK